MSSCSPAIRSLADLEQMWSQTEYSMSDFIRQHGQRIPVVICMSEGYSGADDLHSVSVDDVRHIGSTIVLRDFFSARAQNVQC